MSSTSRCTRSGTGWASCPCRHLTRRTYPLFAALALALVGCSGSPPAPDARYLPTVEAFEPPRTSVRTEPAQTPVPQPVGIQRPLEWWEPGPATNPLWLAMMAESDAPWSIALNFNQARRYEEYSNTLRSECNFVAPTFDEVREGATYIGMPPLDWRRTYGFGLTVSVHQVEPGLDRSIVETVNASGQCAGEVRRRVYADAQRMFDVLSLNHSDSLLLAFEPSVVTDVDRDAAWVACMADRGHEFDGWPSIRDHILAMNGVVDIAGVGRHSFEDALREEVRISRSDWDCSIVDRERARLDLFALQDRLIALSDQTPSEILKLTD